MCPEVFGQFLKTLLRRNDLSHQALKDLHESIDPNKSSWLSTSQISVLRQGKAAAPGPKVLDALGQVNLCLAALDGVETEGLDVAYDAKMLPASCKHLAAHRWFAVCNDTGRPMNAGDLFMLWLGRSSVADLDEGFTDATARAVCQKVSLTYQDWLRREGRTPYEEMDFLETCCENPKELAAVLLLGKSLSGSEMPEQSACFRRVLARCVGEDGVLGEGAWARFVATGQL